VGDVESSLHRELKGRYGPQTGGRAEVSLRGYRVDAVAGDGEVVEVQSGPLGPLRGKLARLLPVSRIRVVKPVVVARRVVKRARSNGVDLSARFSPKRGTVADVFDDLVGLVQLFPHPNLRIDVLAVEIDEVRLARRRCRRGYEVLDRALRTVVGSLTLHSADDLWDLLPRECRDAPFTTRDLAATLGRSVEFSQRVAYCLRLAGAVETVGKTGNSRVYVRSGALAATRDES
jgi:hypothetical protein